jgi:ATP-dependent Clp protease ATP-binding subunit ClpA
MSAGKKKGRIGSSFNDFLKDEGLDQEASAVAIKRVLAWQLEKAMAKEGVTTNEVAKRMRAAVSWSGSSIRITTRFSSTRCSRLHAF